MDDEPEIGTILEFDPESEDEPEDEPELSEPLELDPGTDPQISEARVRRIMSRLGDALRRISSPIVRVFRRIWDPVARLIRRVQSSIARAIAWLHKPDEVGEPLTLHPRAVRLLVLLIAGNLIILVLLTIGLYKASTSQPVADSPLLIPIVATPTAGPSPIPSSTPTPGPSPTPFGSGGAIAFTLRRNGNADIYALNQVDRQLLRLTHDQAEDRDPAWSPDGKFIAFASNRADNWDIYLLDLLSGTLIRLTHHRAFDANPTWSPDGEWIAFESHRSGNLDIYVMSTTGQQLRRITSDLDPNYEPAWAPDSQAIVYTTFRDGNKDIYVHPLNVHRGEEAINITQSPDLDEDSAVWSPDGSQLAYISGPSGSSSVQVTTFDWDTLTTDQAQTALFGAGTSPAWAPDGQSLIYAYDRGAYSHIVAADMTGWALFHEVYSIDEPLDDLAWTSVPLSPRVIAQVQANEPPKPPPFYIELMQSTPTAGPPYRLIPLPNVVVKAGADEDKIQIEFPTSDEEGAEDGDADEGENGDENGDENSDGSGDEAGTRNAGAGGPDNQDPPDDNEEEEDRDNVEVEGPFLSDRVNESFNALRQRVIEKAGWDYLTILSVGQLPMDFTPYSGQSRMTWHVCGRAIGLDREPYEEDPPRIEMVREEAGSVTYWRVFIRTEQQDGSMGEPLREGVWDLTARQEDGRAMVEGGELKERIPRGYYVDFTTLASGYGWERVPALWRWRWFWPDIMWWRFRKTDDLTWWDCMLEIHEPEAIENSFGPIPGYEVESE